MALNKQILYFELVDSVYRKTISVTNVRQYCREHWLAACEYFLGSTLRKYCDHRGKEKNADVTGRIIHEIGRVYRRRSPDKMSLIKAAVLFNAALQRKPGNVAEVREDLSELCNHALKLANAVDMKADVVNQAQVAKSKIGKLRKLVQSHFDHSTTQTCVSNETEKCNRIKKIENLQLQVTEGYSEAMKGIMAFCVDAIGPPPCTYALVGMGSLAKQEITPYSDFENLIVLQEGVQDQSNYETILEYYRWTAVLFQIILVNMGETILPFMDIFALRGWLYDAFTKCGVSPDGFAPQASKNPLGRQQGTPSKPWTTELIKPVQEMLKYTKPIHDLKNGYHLADMLGKTCFVAGDELVYNEFARGVRDNSGAREEKFFEEVRDDLKNFSIMSRLPYVQDSRQLDVKRVLFRVTTLFVSALGRYYKIHEPSSFKITRKLIECGAMEEEFGQDVLCSLAIACEVRQKVYSRMDAQEDRVPNKKRENKSTIVELLGEETAVFYFETAWKLQRLVAETVGGENPLKRDEENPVMTRVWIYYSLSLWSKTLDACRQLELLDLPVDVVEPKHALLIGLCYVKLEQYKDALKYLRAVKTKLQGSESLDLLVSETEIRNCLMKLGHQAEALQSLAESVEIRNKLLKGGTVPDLWSAVTMMSKNMVQHPLKDEKQESHHVIAKRLHFYGHVCRGRQEMQLALMFYLRELEIRKRLTADPLQDKKVAKCYLYVGECYLYLNNLEQADTYLERAGTIYALNNFTPVHGMVLELNRAQLALHRKQYDHAMAHFRNQLELELGIGEKNFLRIGSCHCGIGTGHFYKGNYDEAVECYETAIDVYALSKVEVLRNQSIAFCHRWISEARRQKREVEAKREMPHSSSQRP